MQIKLSASDIKSQKKADDRGRVTLGSEYAGKTVTVAVLEVEDEDDVRTEGGTQTVGNLDYCDECVAETLHYRDETDGMWTCASCGRWSA